MRQNSEIAIVGRACRLPGANSVAQLWAMLHDGRCAITRVPTDRWSMERFGHPRHNERGRSYTWAAGVVDDIWGFDPAALGVSPREAEQMDPQQRLLLELTWEALEDAGIRPSSLAGSETGVFVGASTTDHGNSKMFDIASTDGYFATGNAASILANRISYIYDLNGPSFTVDTACSSSLVALDAAVQALRSGRIDTAIVGGVSILTTPFQFVNFSQASMLSRIGLCQPFSAKADGYVRAEGGGVIVLRSPEAAVREGDRVHATIIGTRVNSDGRTNGIALPSTKRQAQLLQQLYAAQGIDPNRLAFVEAHGTGTPVGDPVEAGALGEVLGQQRTAPLPVGSVKSNIGHTEAAAGLAGLMKAMLALEHDLLPASINCTELNPNIDFERLNLSVATTNLPLARAREPRLAGISSYGFGGTNAHVVIGDAPSRPAMPAPALPDVMMLSAHSRSALGALAEAYADRIAAHGGADLAAVAAAANHRRDRREERLVVPLADGTDIAGMLRAFAKGGADAAPEVTIGTAVGRDVPVAFVYSGNGGQWAGMGRSAYRDSAAFRRRFDAVDALFQGISGWSLAQAMNADDLAERLVKTSVAQPLIYAIQSATTFALAELGLTPSLVFGHSVGEVAAAEAAGILDLTSAVKVIYYRSLHQELAFESGGMVVLIGSREAAETIVADVPDLTIAAYNSPRAYTLSGPPSALAAAAAAARALKSRTQKLDIAYPFHSALVGPIEEPLLADLAGLAPKMGGTTFVSTVSGEIEAGGRLDATYWWRNVREPVLFSQAVETAARQGARLFIEIGPSPILLSHINDTLAVAEVQVATLAVLDKRDDAPLPFHRAAANALARGAGFTGDGILGTPAPIPADLPTYPWQRKTFRLGDTVEAIAFLSPRPWHPLIGARYAMDQLEWHTQIDTALLPDLADHVVDGHVLLPGAAFAEMALAVARDWLGGDTAAVADFEIHNPMILPPGASRDVRCRVQPVTGTLEIMSRARLGSPTWQVHAVAKILHPGTQRVEAAPALPALGAPTMASAVLYPLALASGLEYGPAFRLLDAAYRVAPGTIVVDLAHGNGDARFGLDPMRVDACFHGLALLYRELSSKGRLKPYVPVGASEINLYRPGVPVARAIIDVVRSDERTIIVHFTLLDAAGQPIARLYKMRFQAMNAFRSGERTIEPIVATQVLAAEPLAVPEGTPLSAADVAAAARRSGAVAAGETQPSGDYVLMDGWATATAFGLFEVLADDGRLDLPALFAAGRLPEALSPWCARLLASLARSGLVTRADDGGYAIVSGADLPDPQDILRALAADHPERSAELLLAARTGAIVDSLAAGSNDMSTPVSMTAVESFDAGGHAAHGSAALLAATLDALVPAWPKGRALRLLQVGDGPLTAHAARFAARVGAELTVLEADRRRLERARLAFEHLDGVSFEGQCEKLPPAGFDVVIASQSLHRIADDRAGWAALAQALAPGALLAAIEPEGSVFRELVFGLHDAMTNGADGAGVSVASEAGWSRALDELGLTDITILPTAGADYALLCIAQKAASRAAKTLKGDALVIGEGASTRDAAAALATMLRFSGLKATSITDGMTPVDAMAELPETIVYLGGAHPGAGPAEALATRCMALKALAPALGSKKLTLWIVCPGATRATDAAASPVESGLWAFARAFANENPSIDVKLVDLDPGLAADVAARRLRDVVLSGTAETDVVVDAASTRVVRYHKLGLEERSTQSPEDAAIRLVKGDHGGGLDRLHWSLDRRRAPEAGEVEIAVEAAGLNFRDVMWGLSILPEEILEDGYAGATLGLECAGRVVRVGPGVDRFSAGDPVLAFAKAALSTHVTVAASVVAPIPPGFSTVAAATVPVAFLTAYYGLIRCARLEEEEWVLIHGGAGGVGLAAMQIARWRGARIIATAGSTERRDLLVALGAEHVFDSRSNQFVDDIRRVTGSGVAVVLNSLSGEAMERSIAVLRPFGRFVELGKRDYVANTHIGLKPFRRNLSYFGVDLDQLILKDDTTGQALFEDVMTLFREGVLSPLPYRAIAASETVEAFRLMQRSGHIGKVVILPPPLPGETGAVPAPFAADPEGCHLVTGGLGGFGLATARWLVDLGARHLVLAGRSGASGAEALATLDVLVGEGVTVEVEQLDITDEPAVRRLFATFGHERPRLAGVVHAAAVIDDAIIANLTREKLDTVLAAKVSGADILDRLTRDSRLDYFILFSSATTMIGNPGQGAYVAANGYLEGLARARRRRGLPAVAVAWGAIEDVGILTRSSASATNLLLRSGVVGMKARAALDRLAEVLPHAQASDAAAVVTLAAVNWATAREHLPVLRSRSFAGLMHGLQSAETGAKSKIGVKALVEKDGAAAASKVIIETVIEEIARILRLPKEDVSRNKPLMDIGLDSLMAVELGMGLEERFELEAPLSTSAGAMTVTELADYIVGSNGEGGSKDQTSEDLALRHLGAEIRKEIVEALPGLGADARKESVY